MTQAASSSLHSCSTVNSDIALCRICRDESIPEPLLSPCHCTGSNGQMHLTCLEKWLSYAARRSCEVCLFKFRARRKRKSFGTWLVSRRERRERRYIYFDTTLFAILTPVASISIWLCVKGAADHRARKEEWAAIALLMLTGFLSLIYLFWLAVTLRYHWYTFREWQKLNTTIMLVLNDQEEADTEECKEQSSLWEIPPPSFLSSTSPEEAADGAASVPISLLDVTTALEMIDLTTLDAEAVDADSLLSRITNHFSNFFTA